MIVIAGVTFFLLIVLLFILICIKIQSEKKRVQIIKGTNEAYNQVIVKPRHSRPINVSPLSRPNLGNGGDENNEIKMSHNQQMQQE